jgi:imidazolonepropionase-like amidohydrolase
MASFIFENARVFDGVSADCAEGMSVFVEDGIVREISQGTLTASDPHRIDLGGRTLMPGLIDLHIHAYASSVDVRKAELAGSTYNAAHAVRMLGHALDCGFTTVRDIGGGDYSLSLALQEELIRGPRFFYAGKILSMTGGHGDFRHMNQGDHYNHNYCSCGSFNVIAHIADGVDECLKAVREELRRGAHCIKIMGSGGVASPTDPIWMNQYREDEIRAIVNECTERRTYVSSHCHPASAVRRSIECGVRCIEHGTLVDAETARFAAQRGAYIVPTMAVCFALMDMGRQLNFPASSQEKLDVAFKAAIQGMQFMRDAGIKVGFGTDLLGETYVQQCREFTIRREVFSPVEILRQATSVAAEILMQEKKLGCIAHGAHADLVVVDGDPVKNIDLLAQDGRRLPFIMRAGKVVKNTLN